MNNIGVMKKMRNGIYKEGMNRKIPIGGFTVGIIVLLLVLGATQPVSAWTRIAPIYINNTAGNALAYYQVNLTVLYDSDMNTNFSDLRVVRVVNETYEFLPYWIENKSDGQWCLLWFNATYIPANSWCNDTYYLLYGNASASDASDGEATFEFFDDFNINTSSQYTVIGYPNAGEFTIETENSWAKTDTSNQHMAWKSATCFSERGYIVETETKTEDDDGIGVGWLQDDGKGYAGIVREDTGFNGGIDKKDNTSENFDNPEALLSNEPPSVTHHWYYIKLSIASNRILLYAKDIEGNYKANASFSDTTYTSGCPALISGSNSPEAYYKYLRVRKYADPEPTALLGAEQSIGGECTAPTISSLTNSTPTTNSVTITWTTNQSADNRVKYSKNNDLSNALWSSWDNDTTSVSITLTGLDPDTTYYYQAWSYNGTNSSCYTVEPSSQPYRSFTTQSSGGQYTITLEQGYNMIGWTSTTSRTSSELCSIVPNCSYVYKKNPDGSWTTKHCGYPGGDFTVSRGFGFLAYITQECEWTRDE